MARQVYQHVGALRPKRSVFNNSHSKLYDCDMGQLIPVCFMECVPGDVHQIGMEAVVRFQPLVAPVLHEIYIRSFYFFVPTRLIMNRDTVQDLGDSGIWEDFITGGDDGNDDTVLPTWTPPAGGYQKYSLWDYFGLPLGVVPTADSMPISFPKRCYNLVYNEYIRDQNVQDEVSLDDDAVKYISWRKDRFTSALYDTQRGDRPAIPLQGLTSVQFNGQIVGDTPAANSVYPIGMNNLTNIPGPVLSSSRVRMDSGATPPSWGNNVVAAGQAANSFKNWLNNNSLNMSQAVTFDTVDMRRLFQYQKYMERNMRAGARYAEQIPARFGVRPQDYRLQRPEFIGGSRSPIIVSEVLQTSESSNSSKQGNLAGHGISAESTRIGNVRCYEHGYIIGLAVIQPEAKYVQGIHKELQRRTKYDFLTPELVNLSEVAVKNSELVVTGTSRDDEIFGFNGIYDEYRVRESMVVGDMRGALSYWHLARLDYNSANPPNLNENFIKCIPDKRIFAVQNVPGCIVSYGNRIRSVRPLPIIAEPGLIDHH